MLSRKKTKIIQTFNYRLFNYVNDSLKYYWWPQLGAKVVSPLTKDRLEQSFVQVDLKEEVYGVHEVMAKDGEAESRWGQPSIL